MFLGCYIDLWCLVENWFLFLVDWFGLIGWMVLVKLIGVCFGLFLLMVVDCIGLLSGMFVFNGIYDFNVLFYFYFFRWMLLFFVVFIGIWVIVLIVGGDDVVFDLVWDMFINVNVFGDLVYLVCFMGGWEFDLVMKGVILGFNVVDIVYVLVEYIMLFLVVELCFGFFFGYDVGWSIFEVDFSDGV